MGLKVWLFILPLFSMAVTASELPIEIVGIRYSFEHQDVELLEAALAQTVNYYPHWPAAKQVIFGGHFRTLLSGRSGLFVRYQRALHTPGRRERGVIRDQSSQLICGLFFWHNGVHVEAFLRPRARELVTAAAARSLGELRLLGLPSQRDLQVLSVLFSDANPVQSEADRAFLTHAEFRDFVNNPEADSSGSQSFD